jgi:hypothetical protein
VYNTVDDLVRGAEYLAYLIAGDDEQYQTRRRAVEAESRRKQKEQDALQARAKSRRTLDGIRAGLEGAMSGVEAVTVDLAGGMGVLFDPPGEDGAFGANIGGCVWIGPFLALGPVVGFAAESDYSLQAFQAGFLLALRAHAGNRSGFGVTLDLGYLNTGALFSGFYYAVGVRLDRFLIQVMANTKGLYGAVGYTFLAASR